MKPKPYPLRLTPVDVVLKPPPSPSAPITVTRPRSVVVQHSREFDKRVERLAHRHPRWRVFADFCEMAALSLANAIPRVEALEQRYQQVIKPYDKAELAVFPEMLGHVVEGLDGLDCDFLGDAFMRLELSSHWHGQFFTPFHLCAVMARLILDADHVRAVVADRGFITVQEPACGAGAMLIGVVDALRSMGLNPQECLHVTAIDVDPTAAHMCFVQCSLMGLPAEVIVGNTLTMEMRQSYFTPAHHLGFWQGKLRRGYAMGTPAAERA